jgi:hypothetical protein
MWLTRSSLTKSGKRRIVFSSERQQNAVTRKSQLESCAMIKRDLRRERRFTVCIKGGHDGDYVLPGSLQSTGGDVRA